MNRCKTVLGTLLLAAAAAPGLRAVADEAPPPVGVLCKHGECPQRPLRLTVELLPGVDVQAFVERPRPGENAHGGRIFAGKPRLLVPGLLSRGVSPSRYVTGRDNLLRVRFF